jgi:hypothetical protein
MRAAVVCLYGSLVMTGLWAADAGAEWVDAKQMAQIQARRNFWSFQPVTRPAVPPAPAGSAAVLPIDRFLLDRLTQTKLGFASELDKASLIRRVTLDVTGLPPTPDEVKAFLADRSPQAYEKLVDRLMASRHYGERWAQRWLDVVRYADTNGFELDAERTHAWRYRDYVVDSFNRNKPFDRFILEQIAGDEIWPGQPDAHIATGLLRAGPQHVVGGNQDIEQNRQELLIEMTASVGSGFLGLTLNCARCHNHKFDPILQADYYRLQAIFAPAGEKEVDIARPIEKLAFEWDWAEYRARLKPIEEQIAAMERPYRRKLRERKREALPLELKAALALAPKERTEEQKRLAKDAEAQIGVSWDEVLAEMPAAEKEIRAGLRKRMHEIELDEPQPPPAAYGVALEDKAPPTHILKVGDHKMKLGEVQPGVPLVLALASGRSDLGDLTRQVRGRRRELAEWIASTRNPLTPRVFVNRMWQFRMGTGLVRTPNDFGALGERPTHPQLLDWLAAEFVESGWDIKKLDRQVLLSRAYRQSAVADAARLAADPDNKLFSRANRRRMEAEMVRDAVLAVSGELNLKAGGPPVKTPIEPEIYDIIFTEAEPDNLWPLPKDPAETRRRTLYALNKRTVRMPMLFNFDQPDAMSLCAQRPVSTHALQALSLMNSEFMAQQAKAFAARIGASKDAVAEAYWLALARSPQPQERVMAQEFFRKGGTLAEFALAMLNRNEFVYLP